MNFKTNILVFLIPIIVFLVSGEILIRTFDYLTFKNLHIGTSVKDPELGWKSKENYQTKRTNDIHYATTENGFKAFEIESKMKPKILFLGDSFTQAIEVSNEDTYYEVLKDSLDFALIAYGMSGYGTLQEKMILENYYPEIQPEIVVLQFCTNDFIDNHYELNLTCNYKIKQSRPYLNRDNSISHKIPLIGLERWTIYSKFLQFLHNQIQKISQKYRWQESGESKIARLNEDFNLYKSSIERTRKILQSIKKTIAPKSKLLVFCADGYEPQLTSIRKLCTEENIPFLEDHFHRLREANAHGENPFASDGVHWNANGHHIVANSLKNEIAKLLSK